VGTDEGTASQVRNRDAPAVTPAPATNAVSARLKSEAGSLAWLAAAAAFCAFLFTNWTANLLWSSSVPGLSRGRMFMLDLGDALLQAVSTFVALGVLWSIACSRAASDDVPFRRAVLVTAGAFWFVTVPFLLVAVAASVLDVREAIGLTSHNSHLWQAALWVFAIAAASKALQHQAKAPELFAALFAFAGYGVLIVLRLVALI
jgi:hypothetical protein